jgi:hypothetical protein
MIVIDTNIYTLTFQIEIPKTDKISQKLPMA